MKLATLCYLRTDSHTLMLHRIKKENDMHAGKWNGLGGKLEPGESPEECAAREVREESGLTVRNPQWRGVITFPAFDGLDDWYVFMYVVYEFAGELIDSPEGRLAWIPNERLSELNMWEGDHIFMPWLWEDRFFSAKFNYQNGKLIDYIVHHYDF